MPNKKKYTLRYDRIAIVAAGLLALIILLVSCVKSCTKEDKPAKVTPAVTTTTPVVTGSGAPASTDTTGTQVEGAAPAGYIKQTLTRADMVKGDLILVNKDHVYTFPENTENLKSIYENKIETYKAKDWVTSLDGNVIEKFNTLMSAYFEAKKNSDILVINGYRTKETQDSNFASSETDIKGGYSEYHTGLSFSLGIFPDGANSYYYEPTGNYAWISEHMAEYGFILRYPADKTEKTGIEGNTYQFRYVGQPHAAYMKENNLCLEEYIDTLRQYAFGTKTLKYQSNGHQYEIYYVAANTAGDTEVFVPGSNTYTVSGNNVDGFIVTVTLA